MHLAKPAIVKEERCFLVEGYTDVMAMHQAGVENVVASSGTALTPGQIQLIRRFTKNVTVIFDGDAAGIRASLRGIDMLLAEGMAVKVVLLPDGDDPDTYAKKVGSDALHRAIHEDAQDFLQFKTKLLSDEAGNDPMKRAEMIRSVVTSIAANPDAIQRSVYLQSSASQLKMDETVLGTEVAKVLHDQPKAAAKRAKRPYGTRPAPAAACRRFWISRKWRLRGPAAPRHLRSETTSSPALSELIENNLVRAMLGVRHRGGLGDHGSAGRRRKSTLEVPFAELVIAPHRRGGHRDEHGHEPSGV